MDLGPAYGASKAAGLQRKSCYGSPRFSVKIFITASGRNSLSKNKKGTLVRRAFGRPLRVSNPGPTGIQSAKNLKPAEVRASRDPFVGGPAFHNYDEFFSNFMASIGSFDVLAAGLGFLAGLAVHLWRPRLPGPQVGGEFAGDWVLFMSPTAFNRYVVLRWPSISIKNNDVNEKLMKDNRHYVKLSTGYRGKSRIPKNADDRFCEGGEFCYQRTCLSAEDGGVISLDWPANLDLAGEQGLDTTVMLVPGTVEGSNDVFVRGFVRKALENGCFPVVMNPRGCAGSPVTTPRLFTAADSDDVCIAAQFISRLRPWTTLMGVGWGYGANMLTKYLGEAAETTPLTAAVCIGNPFDVEEATRSLSHHSVHDKKLTEGLKDILHRNKVLFQGRRKEFDVASALSANSVRDFDMAISRVVHGFDTIEDFYAKASSREIIGRVKVPTLFIQNDHIGAPIFSVPRNSIEDNPFTSLLLCSSMSAGHTSANGQIATVQWCDNLAIEWLAAVELSLLKGRHPLLKDVDITIKPTNQTQKHFMASSIANTSKYKIGHREEKFLDFSDREAFDVFSGVHMNDQDEGHSFQLNSKSTNLEMDNQNVHKLITDAEEQEQKSVGVSQETGSSTEAVDMVEVSQNGEEGEPERGQALQTAETVMRVLDRTMPGTLANEQKQQVLNAVGRGETLITALQSAVPDEVRGKLTAAVSGAVQTRGINLKLVGLSKDAIAHSSMLLQDMNSTGQENVDEVSKGRVDVTAIDNSSSLEGKAFETATELDTDNTKPQEVLGMKSSGEGSDAHQSEGTPKNVGIKTKSEDAEELDSPRVDSNLPEQVVGSSSVSKKTPEDMQEQPKTHQDSEGTAKNYEQQRTGKLGGSETCVDEQNKCKESATEADRKSESEQQPKWESAPDQKNDDKNMSSQEDEGKQIPGAKVDDPSLGMGSNEQNKELESTSEFDGKPAGEQPTKGEETTDQKNDEKSVNSQGEQNKQTSEPKADDSPPQGGVTSVQSPAISVGQAFNALTGFDDSTQMAVTSVFGVIENMIDQLEKEKLQKAEDIKQSKNENQDQDHSPPQKGSSKSSDKNGLSKQEQVSTIAKNSCDSSQNAEEGFHIAQQSNLAAREEKLILNLDQIQRQEIRHTPSSYDINYNTPGVGNSTHEHGVENQNINAREGGKGSGLSSVSPKTVRHMDKFPLQAKENHFGTISFKEFPSGKNPPFTQSKTGFENTESINDLFLEYVPEDGQWKLLEQIESSLDSFKGESLHDTTKLNGPKRHIKSGKNMPTDVIEPSYVILNTHIDSDNTWEGQSVQNRPVQEISEETKKAEDIMSLVKNLVLDALRLEVIRRLGMSRMEALKFDLEEELSNVANAVALAVKQDLQRSGKAMSRGTENVKHLKNYRELEVSKFGPLNGELIVSAISSVLTGTYVLGRLIPAGIVVGASLAALRPLFIVVTGEEDLVDTENVYEPVAGWKYRTSKSRQSFGRKEVKLIDSTETKNQEEPMHNERHQNAQDGTSENRGKNDGKAIVGAMTAALGATAALTTHQMKQSGLLKNNEDVDTTVDSSLEGRSQTQAICDDRNSDESERENVKLNIVSSLAEKAMSVAAPVVPTKKDGELDHERLVAVLADLGQQGGILRLVGKAALLWGGLRGAMSLTDRLIMFFHIAERPLHQRLLGFTCMALLLWSPVVVPLLPTILAHWSSNMSLGMAGIACNIGLYGATVILVTIWGKRIRGYQQPLEQYGLSVSSVSEILNLSKGVVIGLMLVISVYSANIFLGHAVFTLKPEFSLSLSMGFVSVIKTCFRISSLVLHALGMGLATATIKELLFRSWLHEEIASDLGFHKAVILSGILFSFIQWSLPVMPSLWLLSVSLSGARAKSNGNLAASVGLHGGLTAGNLIIEAGSFVRYNSTAPGWLTGAYAGHPFGGVLGLGFIAILALLLYPWDGDPEAQKLQTFKKKQVFPNQWLGNTG